jgi:hypothetical protein
VAVFECRNSGEACRTGRMPVDRVMIVVEGSEMRASRSEVTGGSRRRYGLTPGNRRMSKC